MEEKKEFDAAKIIEEINETIKRIDKSLERMAGSVDPHDGVFCIKGDVTVEKDW